MMKMTEIADINPWWSQGKNFETMDQDLKNIQGIYFQFREIDLSLNNIYFILGPRQVGKTVYLKKIIARLLRHDFPPRQIYYLNAELFISGAETAKALEYFFEANRNKPQFYIFLDNFTLVRGWTDIVRRIIADGLIRNGTLVITGSQDLNETEQSGIAMEPQAAIKIHYLKPLSFSSFVRQAAAEYGRTMPTTDAATMLKETAPALATVDYRLAIEPDRLWEAAKSLQPYAETLNLMLQAYFVTGGFPVAVNEHLGLVQRRSGPEAAEIITHALLADLARQDRREAVVRHLMKWLFDRYGSRFSYLKLGRELEITHVTAIQYLAILERAFVTETILAYDFHKRQPKTKGDKKVYLPDPFVRSALHAFAFGRDPAAIPGEVNRRPDGPDRLIEGIVIGHLRGHLGHDRIWFYYDPAGHEIAIIADTAAGFIGVDVDFGERIGRSGWKRVAAVPRYAVLSRASYDQAGRRIRVPAAVFLALLAPSDQAL